MKVIAESFAWPFRGDWRPKWALGLLCVALLPLLFIPLLGYAIEATRAAESDASQGPPPWRPSVSLVLAGGWVSFAVLVSTIPFVLVFQPLAGLLLAAGVAAFSDPIVADFSAHALAALLLALPWGLLLLVLMPHATARFAATYEVQDLFDVGASIRSVTRDFATWNVAGAAIVTAWIVGLACAGLLCVGVVPGIFYAILVSAHASAALNRQSQHPRAG